MTGRSSNAFLKGTRSFQSIGPTMGKADLQLHCADDRGSGGSHGPLPGRIYEGLSGAGTLKDLDRFSSWLYRIAHNTCFSKLRKDLAKRLSNSSPKRTAWERSIENRLAVEKALQHLPEDQREVVVLKVFQSLKFEEIAEIQGVPVSTVKSRLYMAFEKLRMILE